MLEDDPDDAEIICRHLRQGSTLLGRIVACRDGFQRELTQWKPDLILLDYRVPGFCGREALQIATRLKPRTPVIFVSGTVDSELEAKLLHEGAAGYVLKQQLHALTPLVERLIRKSRVKERSALA